MANYLPFALLSIGMVITPGPSMVYLISRSINQGVIAGVISLAGMALGFTFYMLCAALGITAVLFEIPYAYNIIRFGGATYLLWLAWRSVRPGGTSLFHVYNQDTDRASKLFIMGFVTNILNPKIAVMYITLLPQFIDLKSGHIFFQSVTLGLLQISISMLGNFIFIFFAGSISSFFNSHPRWGIFQRYIVGVLLLILAFGIIFS